MKKETKGQLRLFSSQPLSKVESEVLRLKRFGLEDADIFVEICLLYGGAVMVSEIHQAAQAKAQKFEYPMLEVVPND